MHRLVAPLVVIALTGCAQPPTSETGEPEVPVEIANRAPVATVAITPVAPDATTDLVARVDASDADGDALTFSWAWLRNGQKSGITGPTVPAAETAKGDVWEVRVFADDGELQSAMASAVVRVENTAPEVHSVVLSPADPGTRADIVARVQGDDVDGDGISFQFAWSIDGEPVDVIGDTLPAELTSRDDVISVVVVAHDGFVDSAPAAAQVKVGNTVPEITAAAVSPAVPTEASELSCAPSGWSDLDGDPQAVRVQWYVSGELQVDVGATLTGDAFSRGDTVSCVATPFDGRGDGAPVASAVATVANTAPSLAAAGIDTLTPVEGDTLTATHGAAVDVDGDPIAYTYDWFVNGVVVATTPTLGSESFRKGDRVEVEVTPWDDADPGEPVRSDTVFVLNTAPVVDHVSTVPGATLFTDDVIAASYDAHDVDGDALAPTYTWSVNGVELAGGEVLAGELAFERGDSVSVSVSVSDGELDSPAVSSPTLVVQNSAPSVGAATVSPAPLVEGISATCVGSGWADADGDAEDYGIAWSVNGVLVGTGPVLDSDAFEKGDVVSCTLTPVDGFGGVGAAVESTDVVVRNAPPEITEASLSSESPVTDTVLVATAAAIDPDGDPVSFTYSWSVDGVTVFEETTSSTTSSLDGETWFDKGQQVRLLITPHDPTDDGADYETASVTVRNSPPMISALAVSPGVLTTTTDAAASWAVSDADGDSFTETLAWTVNGASAGAGTGLGASSFAKGDQVTFLLTVDDGTDSSSLLADPVTVSNSAPSAPGIELDAGAGSPDDDLICDVVAPSVDADGDPVTYTVEWEVDGSAFTGTTATTTVAGDTIPSTETSNGQTWACVITPHDSTDDGMSTRSADVKLGTDVTFQAGYYWVRASYPAPASDHASVCAAKGLVATAYSVTLTWDASLMDAITGDYAYVSLGDANDSATSMWCYDAGTMPAYATAGECETHNFGSTYDNYGTWGSFTGQRPVFTCTE